MLSTTRAPPAGRTELERMVDIDSAVKAVDNDIYVVTFQGKAARIDLEATGCAETQKRPDTPPVMMYNGTANSTAPASGASGTRR